MQKSEVRRSGEAAWRERVARQERSGLSVQEFCRRKGVSAWNLYRWKRRARIESGDGKRAAPRTELAPREPPAAHGAFLDLGALPAAKEASWEIRLDLGGGVVLRLARR